jgi:cyclic 2,3-diphosphoglycerate synthetase
MRVLVLVDGEHYPPVTRWGIDVARTRGHDVLGALLVGGMEKIGPSDPPDLGVPWMGVVSSSPSGVPGPDSQARDRAEALGAALDALAPDGVLDLSDEPVLGYRERMELAAVSLARGVVYLGPDFRLDPPIHDAPIPVTSIAVIGTGKRSGKTAIAGEVARVCDAEGLEPMVVAMGRGGPAKPDVVEPGSVTVERLLGLVREGRHAASDYLEDALTTGVATIGARRVGGGLAGGPFASNVAAAAQAAVERGAGLVVLEGSGASVPTVPWDAGVLVVPASAPPEYLGGYLGPYRLLLSDLVVVTMAASPSTGHGNLPALRSHVHRLRADVRVLVTDFHPVALGDVRGRDAFFATTAPDDVAARQAEHLGASAGCRVVGWSAGLADRARLAEDMDAAKDYEVLLTELKAAAVDVACERAAARDADIVFVDNRAEVLEGDTDLPTAIRETIHLAQRRKGTRSR